MRIEGDNMNGGAPWDVMPVCITVEVMTTCNLQCTHCYLHNCVGLSRSFMKYDQFLLIIERLSDLIRDGKEFNFASVEGLLHPNTFEMIDAVRRYNPSILIPIFTNGMLLTTEKVSKLLDRGINDIYVSLDGCIKETVEAFKTGADFNRVTENMRNAVKFSRGKLRVSTVFLSHRHNICELPNYVDFCASMGVSSIFVSGLLTFDPKMEYMALYSYEGNIVAEHAMHEAQLRARRHGIDFSPRPLRLKKEKFECAFGRSKLYVTEYGRVVPCSVLARPIPLAFLGEYGLTSPIVYGNILEKTAEELWNKPAYSSFRQKLYKGMLPQECRLCPTAHGVIC